MKTLHSMIGRIVTESRKGGRVHGPRRRRRGLALLLVVVVLAITAVLGFAMLSSTSLRAAASGNVLRAVSAEGLAESGVELACYYLTYPQNAPTPVAAGSFWSGGTGITLGANVPGTIDVEVTKIAERDYRIVSTGHSDNSVRRVVTAEVRVDPGFQVNHGAAFSADANLTLNTKIYGDILVKGLLVNDGLVDGIVYTDLLPLGSGTIGNLLGLAASPLTHLPSLSTIRDFSTYTYNGATYSAVEISSLPTGSTWGPTPANPAGVFICRVPLYIYNNTRINGTLILETGASLNISGGGNQIQPLDGFPGLIAKSDVFLRGSGSSRNLKIDGLSWVSGSIKSAGLLLSNCFIEFDGAVLFGNGGSVDLLFTGAVKVMHNPSKIRNVNLDSSVSPGGIKVMSYK